ncbi:MAG: efflux RND transporter periplasmic adaptor subunit [Burkholderiaceae bacterium]|nr:efflux RND transporter periplasmic adaptor subunit [Burkholderiaceae bacterium]
MKPPSLKSVTLAAGLILALGCAGYLAIGQHGPGIPAYITARAAVQDIERAVLASAVLEPARLVTVGARASGQVVKLHVALGDTVKAGQLIAEIDSQPQRNALNNAQAALDSVKAQRAARQVNLQQAGRVLVRQDNLLRLDATSRDTYETALANRDALVAEIAALDAQIRQQAAAVETARTDLGYTRIVAPIAGTVIAVLTEEGRTVNAFQSAPAIVMLAQLTVMKVKAEISEADVIRVRPGQKAYFTILGDTARRYYATLQTVEPAPTSIVSKAEQVGISGASQGSAATKTAIYYNGSFEMPNPDGVLRPMMTAQVHIVQDEAKQVVTIPVTALGERQADGSQEVRVVGEDGRALPRRIQTGLNNGVLVQVLSGLAAGDRVVIGDASQAVPGGENWGR